MKIQKPDYIKTLGLIALIGIILTQSNITSLKTLDIQSNNNTQLKIIKTPIGATYSSPISIDGNYELVLFIHNKGLTGEGTFNSPYIIENYYISASVASGIEILNINAHLIIRNCYISGGLPNENDGIYLYRTSNVIITNNTLLDNDSGIRLRYFCYNNTLSKNHITTSYPYSEFTSGIILWSDCDNNKIQENYVNNTRYGIKISNSDNNNILGNNITFNLYGVELNNHCDNCTISGNQIINSALGVNFFYDCTENIIFGNNISNGGLGIELDNVCNNNLIYFNDIYENVNGQANEKHWCTGNQWDNGTIGNYWGDYAEKYPDARNNGDFWKTPYEIDGDGTGIDNFPLVKSIAEYEPIKGIKISGFPIVNMIIFISVGIFLLKKRIKIQK